MLTRDGGVEVEALCSQAGGQQRLAVGGEGTARVEEQKEGVVTVRTAQKFGHSELRAKLDCAANGIFKRPKAFRKNVW